MINKNIRNDNIIFEIEINMKTIKIYEKTETVKLQKLLKKYENYLEKSELSLSNMESDNLYDENLKNKIADYEIDISLIRMELNKRLWKEK